MMKKTSGDSHAVIGKLGTCRFARLTRDFSIRRKNGALRQLVMLSNPRVSAEMLVTFFF